MTKTLEDVLKEEALTAFGVAIQAVAVGADEKNQCLLAIDTSLQVILEVLAAGAGGKDFYAGLHVAQLVAIQIMSMNASAIQQSIGANSRTPVVFVLPPQPTVVKLIADVVRPLENVRSCAVLWFPPATTECTLEMERQGVAGFVRQQNLPLGLIPVDSRVMALCRDSVFGELYVRGDQRALTEVVHSILAIERHTGRRIYDVSCHGEFALRVKKLLEMSHRVQKKPPSGRDQTVGTPIQKLIVVDRMQDPLSMLLTPMTYEGLLDALVGMNHGVVTYAKEDMERSSASSTPAEQDEVPSSALASQKIILNHTDELYTEIRDANFNILISRMLVNIAQDLVSEVRGGPAGYDSTGMGSTSNPQAATFAQVQALLKKVPNLVKKKRSLAHHLELVQQIRLLSNQHALRGCVETEMLIMSAGKSSSSSLAKDIDRFLEESILRDPLLQFYDVVKLLCLCSLARGGLKPEKLAWYRRQLCHTYGYQMLPLLVQLEKLDLLSSQNKFDFPNIRKSLALMRGVLDDEETQSPKDIHFMFPYTGYAPMSVRLVQGTLGMKFKSSNLMSIFSNDSPSPSATGTSSSPSSRQRPSAGSSQSDSVASARAATDAPESSRINVLVYYIGGVTVAEIAAYRFLNQKQSRFTFSIAATSICNGYRLLRAI